MIRLPAGWEELLEDAKAGISDPVQYSDSQKQPPLKTILDERLKAKYGDENNE